MMVHKSCLSRHSVTLWRRCGEVVCVKQDGSGCCIHEQTSSILMHDENHYNYMFMVQTILYL